MLAAALEYTAAMTGSFEAAMVAAEGWFPRGWFAPGMEGEEHRGAAVSELSVLLGRGTRQSFEVIKDIKRELLRSLSRKRSEAEEREIEGGRGRRKGNK